MRLTILLPLLSFVLAPVTVMATDRYYSDIRVKSPTGRYKVEAKSPENQSKRPFPFQSQFTYTFTDTRTGTVFWTRQQPMREPIVLTSGDSILVPAEGSPIDIIVSDEGWTAIRTAYDGLICVDPAGVEHGHISILADAITNEESRKYTRETFHDVRWSGYSLWYFLNSTDGYVFVIRPWWGRRIVIDTETGGLKNETDAVRQAAMAYERRYVTTNLAKARKGDNEEIWPTLYAAYLAGHLQVSEAIPDLKVLELSEYSGSTTVLPAVGNPFNRDVDPNSYSTATLRQVVQLSLRRLGATPKTLPVHTFRLRSPGSSAPTPTPALTVARHENVDQIKVGMNAKEVLALIGSPDYVARDSWSYDMDSDPPYSLNLTWNVKTVTKITREDPPIWKSGFARDREIVD